MNYRHIFHAGNICDVVKHGVLTLVLGHLRQKETPFCMLDTHAGIGMYDLNDARAAKTSEAQSGIMHLLNAAPLPELARYYDVLKKLNPGWDGKSAGGFRYYPGSPVLAVNMMRPSGIAKAMPDLGTNPAKPLGGDGQDRLIACELHPEDGEELKRQLHSYRNAQPHRRDGYEAMGAFLPPPEKRGLVLIDPPFEAPDEFDKLAKALISAHARWPQGILMGWYPIKERPAIWRFHEALVSAGIEKLLMAEFIYQPEVQHDRLNGSGLILINPPWQMQERLSALFPALHTALGTTFQGDKVASLGKSAP